MCKYYMSEREIEKEMDFPDVMQFFGVERIWGGILNDTHIKNKKVNSQKKGTTIEELKQKSKKTKTNEVSLWRTWIKYEEKWRRTFNLK